MSEGTGEARLPASDMKEKEMAYNGRGARTGAHTGTYKGGPSLTYSYSSGRRDIFYGGQNGSALGKNHGHRVSTASGFPIYDRKPGNKKQTSKSAFSLSKLLGF